MLKQYLNYVEERGFAKIPARRKRPEGREITGDNGEYIRIWPKSIDHNGKFRIKMPHKLADYAPLYEALSLKPGYLFNFDQVDPDESIYIAKDNKLDYFVVDSVEIHREEIFSRPDDPEEPLTYYPLSLNRKALALYEKAPNPPRNLERFFDGLLQEGVIKTNSLIRSKAKHLYICAIPHTNKVGIYLEKHKPIPIDPIDRVHPLFEDTDMKTSRPGDNVIDPEEIFKY